MKSFLSIVVFLITAIVSRAQEEEKQSPFPSTTIYTGDLPCSACDSIRCLLEITTQNDTSGTFYLKNVYIKNQQKIIATAVSGSWEIDHESHDGETWRVLQLNDVPNLKTKYFYIRNDGNLVPLNSEKEVITAYFDCLLHKSAITDGTPNNLTK